MKNVIAVISIVTVLLTAVPAVADRPDASVTVRNNTDVRVMVWAEYSDRNTTARSEELVIPPRGTADFEVPVGIITIYADAWEHRDVVTGRTYRAKSVYQRNNPGQGKKPNPVVWNLTYDDLGMDPSIKDGEPESTAPPATANFTGKWDCKNYAVLEITQSAGGIEGEISGQASNYLWIKEYGKGTISGHVVAVNRTDMRITFSNGDYVRGNGFTMKQGLNKMAGLAPIMYSNGKYKSGGAHSVICYRKN